VLRRETANRARPAKIVAVLADPVFDVADARVQMATADDRQEGGAQPTPGARDDGRLELTYSRALLERAFRLGPTTEADGAVRETARITRLPFTRFEADGILAAVPPGQGLKATGFRANRETATGADLAQYRFVHFATHGILNSEHPELSGIVLSLVNERGQPADGFLRLNEIYNLNLPVDLVVLSACQTGLGKEIRGEGLVGLTRGFMYAGAPRVVASLWKVDDAATAELMKRFYRGMLKDNLPPAAALREAKNGMRKERRWSAPFYWAAFELQGEWR
jgi:CHAT domain-containing protein